MAGIRDELEPGILPRQLAEIERVAARLDSERPAPAPALAEQVDQIMLGDAGGDAPASLVAAWACLGSGVLLLLLVALVALS